MHQPVVEELNTHVFFVAILQKFHERGLGDAKIRAIIGAVNGTGHCGRIPTVDEVDAYCTPPTSKLYLSDVLKTELRSLCAEYAAPRSVSLPALAIKVMPMQNKRGETYFLVSCVLHNQVINVRLPDVYHRFLHSSLGNSIYYKYMAFWCALRLFRTGDVGGPRKFVASNLDIELGMNGARHSKKYDLVALEVDV